MPWSRRCWQCSHGWRSAASIERTEPRIGAVGVRRRGMGNPDPRPREASSRRMAMPVTGQCSTGKVRSFVMNHRDDKVKRRAGKGGWEPLLDLLRKFRDDRDWKQFHNPKDLAAAIAIEAGELQEHFLWKSTQEVAAELADARRHGAVVDELADVLICAALGRLPGGRHRRGGAGEDAGQRPEIPRQQGEGLGPQVHRTGRPVTVGRRGAPRPCRCVSARCSFRQAVGKASVACSGSRARSRSPEASRVQGPPSGYQTSTAIPPTCSRIEPIRNPLRRDTQLVDGLQTLRIDFHRWLWIKCPAAGCGGRHLRKTSAFSGVSHVEKGQG